MSLTSAFMLWRVARPYARLVRTADALLQVGVIRSIRLIRRPVSVGSSLQAGVRLLVSRPASVLPVYLLVLGLTAAARVPILLAVAIIIALLAADGRLQTLVQETQEAIEGIDPDVEPTPENIIDTFPESLEAAIIDVFTPTVVLLIFLGIGLSILVALVANALGNAAALNGVYGALRDDNAALAAVSGIGRDWKPFVGLAVVQAAIVILLALPVVVGLSLFAVSGVAGGFATGLAVLFSGSLLLVATLLLAFTGQSIVIDRVGLAPAIRNSVRFPLERPAAFVGYILVALGVFGLFSLLSSIFGVLGVSQLSGIVGPLVLFAFLDIFKVVLYADRAFPAVSEPTRRVAPGTTEATVIDNESTESATTPGLPRRFVAAFSDGLRATGGFVRSHPIPVVGATVVFALASLIGFQLTAQIGTDLPVPEEIGEVFGTFPVATFIMIAANNWLVSATAAFGGVAFGLPTLFDMLLNGALAGAVYGITDPLAFTALVGPHGIIELPAIFVAGGLGFHIAAVTIGVLTGRRTQADLADSLMLAYRVLLGLAVILVIAAFVEAFLTPPIAAAILG